MQIYADKSPRGFLKQSEGLLKASSHLPEIYEQVAIDAKSRTEDCPACDGTGQVTKDDVSVPCKRCKGKGSIYIPGEVERLRLLFDMVEPRVKAGGAVVNLDLRDIKQNERLEDLSSSVAPILAGEVVKPDEPV